MTLACARILFPLIVLIGHSWAQLYGQYNCNNQYCGPNPSTICTAQQNEAAYNAVLSYLAGFATPQDNFAASVAYTTGNGNGAEIPPFQFNWYGSPSLIPIAGSYTGSLALANFFGLVFADTTNFFYTTSFYPPNGGILIPAYNCQFVVVQWLENAKVVSTNKTFTNAPNTIRYTMLNSSVPLIAIADVFVNDGQYQNAFCPGQVNCDGYSNCLSNYSTMSSGDCSSDNYDVVIGIEIAILVVLVLLLIIVVYVHFVKQERTPLADKQIQLK